MKKIKSMWNFVKNKFYKNGITAIAKKDWWQIAPIVCFFIYSIYFYANNLLISDLSDDLYFRVRNFLIFSNILIFGLYFCKKQTKKLIWGVQIQSFKTTIFSLTFSLFLTLFSTIFYNLFEHNEILKCENLSLILENLRNFDQCTKDYAEGATQIMIAIGTSLMAIAIFVFEYITKKDRYFDKYFILGLTNIINLLLIFFLGLILLIFHYLEVAFVSDFIKNFINIYIFTLTLIILSVVRIYKTTICLLDREKTNKIEDDLVLALHQNLDLQFIKNEKEINKQSSVQSVFMFVLKDLIRGGLNNENDIVKFEEKLRIITVFFDCYLNNLDEKKDPNSFNFEEVLKLIPAKFDNKVYMKLIEKLFDNYLKISNYTIVNFLHSYLSNIDLTKNHLGFGASIHAPIKIFKILIAKKFFPEKNNFLFNNSIQNYFYYFHQLYEKGFDLKNSEKKLSRDEKNIANILIDRSWRYPKELAKYNLEPNYKKNKDSDFFKAYAKEILIYYRDLLKTCFDNNDSESFGEISKQVKKLFGYDDRYDTSIDDGAYREIQQYKLLNFYGLASWILEKTDDDSLEKNSQFLNNICFCIEDILLKDVNCYEQEFIKLYLKTIGSDINFTKIKDNLLGLDLWDIRSREVEAVAWMSENRDWINNFFIYFCLARFDKFQISKINDFSNELSKIVGGFGGDGLFIEIINNLDNLLKIYKPANNNNILKLLNKPIENIDNLINDLKSSIHKIRDAMNSKRIDEVINSKIDKYKITNFKEAIQQSYEKSFSIKNIFKQFKLHELKESDKHENQYGINTALDKDYFIENTNINLIGFDESCSNTMVEEENNNILNKTILENPRLAEKLVLTNLNEFEKILKLFDEDVILILLNTGENWFEKELKKRTYYNQNFIAPRLANTSESIPENAVGIYKFNQQKIPVYSIYSETKSGLLVLNKKKLGKLIQYEMNKNVKSIFEKEFYLEILDNEDGQNKDFKELQDNPPNWLKSKGDSDAQENYLRQIVILKFFQSFEFEPDENFEAYLIEMNPYQIKFLDPK